MIEGKKRIKKFIEDFVVRVRQKPGAVVLVEIEWLSWWKCNLNLDERLTWKIKNTNSDTHKIAAIESLLFVIDIYIYQV